MPAGRPCASKPAGADKAGKPGRPNKAAAKAAQKLAAATPAEAFHLHRQAQSQRARVLASVLIPLEGDYSIALRRAPEIAQGYWLQAWVRKQTAADNHVEAIRRDIHTA